MKVFSSRIFLHVMKTDVSFERNVVAINEWEMQIAFKRS